MRFTRVLITTNRKAYRTTNGFKRELASGNISDFFNGLETPPVIRSQLKLESMFFGSVEHQSVDLAKILCSI